MTVASATDRAPYATNGVTNSFPVPFYFLEDGDLSVTYVAADGTATALTLTTDYTVSGAGDEAGGAVVTATTYPTGGFIVIKRAVAIVQETAFPANTPLPSDSLERALDRLTMIAQQQQEVLDRTLTVPDTGTTIDTTLPPPVPGSLIGGNAAGDGYTNVGASGVGAGSIADVNIAGDAAIQSSKLSNTQTGTGAVARTLQAKLGEFVSVADFGADPTGVTDATAAFNNALAASNNVYVPPGTYTIGNAVTLANGQRIYGHRRKSIISIPATFNAAALGCFVFSAGEPGPKVEGLTFIQSQPDSTTPTVYPPVIYAQGVARWLIKECRIACCYDGIDMRGNDGGAVIDDLELCALHVGINIDGCLDTVKVDHLHYWVFAGAGAGIITTNQRSAYRAATAINSARCDDFILSNSILYDCVKALNLYKSASGMTIGTVNNVDFDTSGGLNVTTDARIRVTNCYMTMGATDSYFVNMNGGSVFISNTRIETDQINAAASGMIQATGGALALLGCEISGAAYDKTLVYASGASLILNDCSLSRTANGSYGTPMVSITGTKGTAIGNFCSDIGTGSGTFLAIATDTGFVARDNNLRGWKITTPTSSALANTMVTGNLGTNSNKDEFVGYFSSDAATTVRLPSGWTVSRLAAGNYQLVHNLSLSAASDIAVTANTDGVAAGSFAVYSLTNSITSTARILTYVGTTLTDTGVFFSIKRLRS